MPELDSHLEQRLDPPNPSPHTVLPPAWQSVSNRPNAIGSINAVFANGISLIDEAGAMEGFLSIVAGFGATICLSVFAIDGLRWSSIPLLPVGLVCVLALRHDIITYRHQPILFDRAKGKVHVFLAKPAPWWQVWRWRPGYRIETYDWACIRAEVTELVTLGGGGVPRKDYGLTLAAVESPGSRTVLARFGVGLSYPWAPEAILGLWEHLRRFMRNEGPHVADGDTLYADGNIESLWASLWFGQPLIGPGSRRYWTGEDFDGRWYLTIPYGLLMTLMLPFTMAAGLIRWATHKARPEPRWPDEILASVGDPLDLTAPRLTWTQRRKAANLQKGTRQ